MRYVDRIVKTEQVKFKGLQHTIAAHDGEIYDMMNLTGDHYPVLSTRVHRCMLEHNSGAHGIYGWEKLCVVHKISFLYGGEFKGHVSIGDKVFCCLAPYIIILPDKCYYNYETDVFGSLESEWTGQSITFSGGVAYGEEAAANAITCDGVAWEDYFRVGDAVTISGCSKHSENNKTPIIRGIDGDKLYFSENCFVLDGEDGTDTYTEEGEISIKRSIPDIEGICENENRLFGYCGNTIYASKLGDPFNWYVYDGVDTDSWTTDVGSPGPFTGCVSYGGYPIFFKEDYIYKIYGSYPSQFSLQGSTTKGVLAGCSASLAIAGDVLFYMGVYGVMAYSGGVPRLVSEDLGVERFVNAVGGSDGIKYHICVQDPDGIWRLYVYDTRYGEWYREDDLHITHFAWLNGRLYFLTENGDIWFNGVEGVIPEDSNDCDIPIPWMAEFADWVDGDPNRKCISKLQIRFCLEKEATMKVMLQYDSDGEWHTVRVITGEGIKKSMYLPIIPRRCDHYRLRLEGVGECRIFSLAREYYVGSEI